jgi:hypothetical protein
VQKAAAVQLQLPPLLPLLLQLPRWSRLACCWLLLLLRLQLMLCLQQCRLLLRPHLP